MPVISRVGRPRGHRDGRAGGRWFPPVVGGGATDQFAGFGRVEQLVLRGDGLTTTSLEILTGQRVVVEVVRHAVVTVTESEPHQVAAARNGRGAAAVEGPVASARRQLDAAVGELLLVREVLLVGTGGDVFASAELIALAEQLPAAVVHALATTDRPFGCLLRENDVPVIRELHRWGLLAAGPQAHRLDPALGPSSRVPGREYVMRKSSSGCVFVALTERFAPSVFIPAAAGRSGHASH